MKEYKGFYHNEQQKISTYEHGAHFKYSDLVNELNKLIKKDIIKEEERDISENNKRNDSSIKKIKKKNVKKYILKVPKDSNINNERYSNLNIYENDKEKDDIVEKYSFSKTKKHAAYPTSKSLDRTNINLPKVIINNINSSNHNNTNLTSLRNKSYNPKDLKKLFYESKKEINKEEILPVIDSFNYKKNIKENDNDYNKNKEDFIVNTVKKHKNKRNAKLFLKELNTKNDLMHSEIENYKVRDSNRLRSIFETEKIIKKNNLLNEPNSHNKRYVETVNNDISKQIYLLKKQLLVNPNKKEISKFIDI